jgi:hypothetical protein
MSLLDIAMVWLQCNSYCICSRNFRPCVFCAP